MTKWGHPAVVVSQNYPADFAPLEGLFDMIVADVPCSGEGMFRKDEGAVSDWSLAAVDICSRRQRDILSAIWSALKPGGCLVYSTCTFNRLEDEENVQWIQRQLGADVLPVPCRMEWGIHEGEPGLHFFPHKTRGEGFYVALLRKHDCACEPAARSSSRPFSTLRPTKNPRHAKPSGSAAAPKNFIAEARQWLDGDFVFSADAASCTAFPAHFAELLPLLRQSLRVLCAGIQVGDIVIGLGDEEIVSADGMILAVRGHSIGETVKVTVMRGSEELSFDVTLGSDEELQALQQQLLEEQQQQQQQQQQQWQQQDEGYGNEGYNDIFEELYRYLYENNRGGSYDLSE